MNAFLSSVNFPAGSGNPEQLPENTSNYIPAHHIVKADPLPCPISISAPQLAIGGSISGLQYTKIRNLFRMQGTVGVFSPGDPRLRSG